MPPASGRYARCSAGSLAITADELTPAGGSFSVAIHLTNTGTKPCRTEGYPGVAVLSPAGRQAFQARRTPSGYSGGLHAGQKPKPITLAHGATATAILEGGIHRQPSGRSCPVDHAVLITPPDTATSVRRKVTVYVCTAPQIHPLVAGRTGIG